MKEGGEDDGKEDEEALERDIDFGVDGGEARELIPGPGTCC